MNIQIKKSIDSASALSIARKNSHFFNSNGLKMMEEDFNNRLLFGAFDSENMVGFISFKELSDQAVELSWIAVAPEYQGKTIGTTLVNKGLKLLPKKYSICETKTFGIPFKVKMETDLLPNKGFKSINESALAIEDETFLMEETPIGTKINYRNDVTIKNNFLKLFAKLLIGKPALKFWEHAYIDKLKKMLE